MESDTYGAGRVKMINTAIVITAFIICIGTISFCRLYIDRTFNEIEGILDSALVMDRKMEDIYIKDTRISKLAHKAYKIVETSATDVTKMNHEKETIQSFISDMSHQIKTPLASMAMYMELILNNAGQEEQEEFLLRIKQGIEKLEWLTNMLFKLSRLEAGIIELKPAENNVKKLISDSITSVYAMASKKGIEVRVSEFNDLKLFYDSKWTAEALVNILENAVKYSNENSTIDIYVEELSIYSRITVKNMGMGIKKEDFNNVFKRFYRGEHTENIEGTGLGLYLTRVILEKQGGYVTVDSRHGSSAEFSIFLQNCKK